MTQDRVQNINMESQLVSLCQTYIDRTYPNLQKSGKLTVLSVQNKRQERSKNDKFATMERFKDIVELKLRLTMDRDYYPDHPDVVEIPIDAEDVFVEQRMYGYHNSLHEKMIELRNKPEHQRQQEYGEHLVSLIQRLETDSPDE